MTAGTVTSRPPRLEQEQIMSWEMPFIIGSIIFAVAVIIGGNVWVLWDVLFPRCAQRQDAMSEELEQLLTAESHKA
jgi:hypothetical protein